MSYKKLKERKLKNRRNLLDMPLTAADAQQAVRGALTFMFDDSDAARTEENWFQIKETRDWQLWYGDSYDEAMIALHKAFHELLEEETASQPAVK